MAAVGDGCSTEHSGTKSSDIVAKSAANQGAAKRIYSRAGAIEWSAPHANGITANGITAKPCGRKPLGPEQTSQKHSLAREQARYQRVTHCGVVGLAPTPG